MGIMIIKRFVKGLLSCFMSLRHHEFWPKCIFSKSNSNSIEYLWSKDYSPKSWIRYPECQNPEFQIPECQNPETNIQNSIFQIAKITKINFLIDQNPEIGKIQPPKRGEFGIFTDKMHFRVNLFITTTHLTT